MARVASIGSIVRSASAPSTAPVRSISAAAAGASPIQRASRSALTSSFVRPVLTLCGWSSASQPATASSSALVDEQPLLALVVLEGAGRRVVALAPATAGPDDREAALELLAVEDELELAVGDRPSRGSGVGASGSQVPQSQTITSPAPYCFAGMTPSKSKYSIGWSSTWTAIRRIAGVERRALRDGPADEDALDLEPEVVVEPGRAVALDDEAARSAPAAPGAPAPAPGSSPKSRLRRYSSSGIASVCESRRAGRGAVRRSCASGRRLAGALRSASSSASASAFGLRGGGLRPGLGASPALAPSPRRRDTGFSPLDRGPPWPR